MMKHMRIALLLVLCGMASGCEIPDTTLASGHITHRNGLVTLHVNDAPDAVINAAGDLQIGDKVINVNAAERGLLMLYYQNVMDVNHAGTEIGKAGVQTGKNELNDKVQGKSEAVQQQDANTGKQKLAELSGKICQDQANIKAVQDQLSAQLAEFKPYGNVLTQNDITSCHDDKD
jgi:hypothetical protein